MKIDVLHIDGGRLLCSSYSLGPLPEGEQTIIVNSQVNPPELWAIVETKDGTVSQVNGKFIGQAPGMLMAGDTVGD